MSRGAYRAWVYALFGALTLSSAPLRAETPARPDRTLSFPADHGSHPDFQTEWWYYTGHLFRAGKIPFKERPDYGFQLTFFRRLAKGEPPSNPWGQAFLAHGGLTDHGKGKYFHESRFTRGGLSIAGAREGVFDAWNHRWRAHAVGDVQVLEFELERDGETRISLIGRPEGPPVLHGEGGYSRKGRCDSCASHYYSRPFLDLEGQLVTGNTVELVKGFAWMDHEFMSNSLAEGQSGWDWVSLVTEDGLRLMLYTLRAETPDAEFASGTIVRNGVVTPLAARDFTIRALDHWTSPRSGARYPSKWAISIPSIGYSTVLVPLMADQEVVGKETSEHTIYWEGQVRTEDGKGLGYVELSGYKKGLGKAL